MGCRIFGFYQYFQPAYFIRDPALLKQLTISDFDHFADRPAYMEEDDKDLIGNSLLLLNGQKWRDMRHTMTPAFTGSKMKQMLIFVAECARNMTQHFVKRAENGEEINEDFSAVFGRTLTDVISSCGFGIQVDSFEKKDNELYMMSQRFLNFNAFKFVFLAIAPKIMKFLNIGITEEKVTEFFRPLVFEAIDVRKKNHIVRPDMINIIMQIRNEKHNNPITVDGREDQKSNKIRNWTDNELLAQCFVFFIAGLESSAITLSAFAYEMVVNPEIQERLYAEIKETHDRLNGQPIDYENLLKMKYMEQVLCEVLRKWPTFPRADRVCIKDYHYDDGVTKLHIEKGTPISIPISPIHYDPQYFPNPNQFDPERFSDENKDNIIPGTYLPFGIGPRRCIGIFEIIKSVISTWLTICLFLLFLGQRFAMMQIKVVIYYLLMEFKFLRTDRTQIPMKFKRQMFFLGFKNGVQLKLERREK